MREQIIIAVGLIAVAVCAICGAYYFYGKGADTSDIIAGVSASVGFVMGSVGLILLSRRTNLLDTQTKYQSKQIEIQIRKEIDERFNAAIALLGNDRSSARTGAMYSLYHLAVDDYRTEEKKYCRQVPQILCSHIRSVTGEAKYQGEHKVKPSNEIQTALNLLFKCGGDAGGLYPFFDESGIQLPQADLSSAYLAGANFKGAFLVGANLSLSICHSADFSNAVCVGAVFARAEMIHVIFMSAQLQCADFSGAKCYIASFTGAQFQGARLIFSRFQGANLEFAGFQDAEVTAAQFPGCNMNGAEFQGAHFNSISKTIEHSVSDIVFSNFCGAFAVSDHLPHECILEKRIGRTSCLKTVKFQGKFSDRAIASIRSVEGFLSEEARKKNQQLIKQNATADDIVGTDRLSELGARMCIFGVPNDFFGPTTVKLTGDNTPVVTSHPCINQVIQERDEWGKEMERERTWRTLFF